MMTINIVLPLENKIHIFAQPCNILCICYAQVVGATKLSYLKYDAVPCAVYAIIKYIQYIK